MNKHNIINNINLIKENLAQACDNICRDVSEIHIMAVTKTFSYAYAEVAIEAGISLFGENKVQEAENKYPPPDCRDFSLHMIGSLQKNKAKKAVRFFDCIQSLDSFELAESINKYAREENTVYPVLIEFNIGNEDSKAGFRLDHTLEIIDKFEQYQNINIEGIMAIPPYKEDPEETRPYFVKMREIYDYLKDKPPFYGKFKYLSMGMSSDYVIVVEEGANLIRLGTAIFGERAK